MKSPSLIALMLTVWVQTSLGESVLSPNIVRAGNFAGDGPFLITSDLLPSLRYQQVYGKSDFRSFGQPLLITELSFARVPGTAPIDFTLENVAIFLSTTTRNPDGLSTTFANNLGGDITAVFSGPLHVFDSQDGRFGIHMPLQQPFLYNPESGNLLLDVFNYKTTSLPPVGGYRIEVELSAPDSVSELDGRINDASGFLGSGGMVTLFNVTPVPEPSISVMFGALASSFFRRRTRGS